jgi:serine/threonine-protein kinase HipA
MSEQRYDVLLSDVHVGQLEARDDELVSFRFEAEYRERLSRPVLGQHFEDDLSKTYSGNAPGALPGYFANLLPEGALRGVLERSLGDAEIDDVSLLCALGDDLSGAVRVRRHLERPARPSATAQRSDGNTKEEHPGLRFSLAGVQLKFSMLADEDRLTLPGHGAHGDWIVKLGSAQYACMIENELATMEWARACGFDVPECRLYAVDALDGLPRQHAPKTSPVLAVRRFDRHAEGARVHQEDFAQVMGKTRPPRSNGRYKYAATFEAVAILVKTIVGDEAYFDLVRRLAFVIASGNFDAHLKNWSLTYPDGRRARLSPLYDQICTVAWPEHDRQLALKFAGTRNPGEVDSGRFRRLARKAGANEDETVVAASQTIRRARETFATAMAPRMPDETQRLEIVQHWERVPILREAGPLT